MSQILPSYQHQTDITGKENYKRIFQRNMDIKILNNTLANQIHVKRLYMMIKWDLFQGCTVILTSQCYNVIHNIDQIRKIKHFKRYIKSFL